MPGDALRPVRFVRAWACYRLVMALPWWRARSGGRVWLLYMSILPHAGTWAYQEEIRRDCGADPWAKPEAARDA